MLLVLGLLLWSAAHLFASARPAVRQRLIDMLGHSYRGLFSLEILVALGLIILGWQAMGPQALWQPPAGMRHATMALMPLAVILFISARAPTDIKQFIRHPQLTGVKLWAVAHLLSNGELRSVLLFGGLLAWAVASVIVINQREPWTKPAKVGMGKTMLSAAIGLVITALMVWGHRYFAGMPLM